MNIFAFVGLGLLAVVLADTVPPLPLNGSCVLQQSYKDKCNVCTCFKESAVLCRNIEGCIDESEVPVNTTSTEDELPTNATTNKAEIFYLCKPGAVQQEPFANCDLCKCKNGKWVCDYAHCRRRRDVGADLSTTPCAANDFFRLNCNSCYCNSDRSGYRCTEHICGTDNTSEILVPQSITKNPRSGSEGTSFILQTNNDTEYTPSSNNEKNETPSSVL